MAKLTLKSLQHDGTQYSLRFSEKGGKAREIPVRHDLERLLLTYIAAAGLPGQFSPHSFRVATVTDLLEQNVPLEDVQHLDVLPENWTIALENSDTMRP